MNFSYWVIAIVGVLVAISIGFISMDPGDVIEPRVISTEEKSIACTLQWDPMCGVDGVTYGNSCMLDESDVKLDYQGECVVKEISVNPDILSTLPETHSVEVAEGSGVPGCDATDECFLPYSIDVKVGDTVIWNNVDSAAHTVTSGQVAEGIDGIFDSGLFMSGTSFEFTFNETGTFDYFCMVHPWMTGQVIVN